MAGSTAVKVLDKPEASALGEMVNAELANQIATAKKHPRDEAAALTLLFNLATRSDGVAELCMYSLKRKDKEGKTVFITGPSIRFAELLNYCWGNTRVGARIIEEGQKALVAQGIAYDLQRNTGIMLEIRRGIVTSGGSRFGSDMINVTANAACSIAQRNAIIDCIPQVLWWDIFEQVKAKAVGAGQIPERVQKAVKFFVSKGAVEADILSALGVQSIADMGRDHLEIFIGLQTALKEGSIDAAKIFTAEGEAQRRTLNLTDDGDDGSGDAYTPVDKLVNKQPAKESADPRKSETGAGDKVDGDGDGGVSEESDKPKGRAPKATAGSKQTAAAPKGDGSRTQTLDEPSGDTPKNDQTDTSQADADREDAELLTTLESKLDPAKALSSRKAVEAVRGALNRIATMGPDALKERAEKILKDWPAK